GLLSDRDGSILSCAAAPDASSLPQAADTVDAQKLAARRVIRLQLAAFHTGKLSSGDRRSRVARTRSRCAARAVQRARVLYARKSPRAAATESGGPNRTGARRTVVSVSARGAAKHHRPLSA